MIKGERRREGEGESRSKKRFWKARRGLALDLGWGRMGYSGDWTLIDV